MSDQLLDAAPVDKLAAAFTIPSKIQDVSPELSDVFHELVARMQREAAGMDMNTNQTILIERIASFYVQIKFKEEYGSFSNGQQKEFNAYWLSLTQEFSRQLQAHDHVRHDQLISGVQAIIDDVLKFITDPEDRRKARAVVARRFEALDQ